MRSSEQSPIPASRGTVLITGGGRGIGAATARLAARKGYRVAVNYRVDRESAEAVVDAIREEGGDAAALAADVGSESEVVELFRRVDRELGPLTALVNNAGILRPQTRVESMDAERLAQVLRTNVVGPFLCAREAIHRLSTARGGPGGVIVNVSSRASQLRGKETGAPVRPRKL